MGSAVGPLITCCPITAPASGAAVVSMIVTIATAAGDSGTCSWYVRVPVTDALAAAVGTTVKPARSATTTAARMARRRPVRVDGTWRPQLQVPGRILRLPGTYEA